MADEEEGFKRRAELRARWQGLVHALAPTLAFSIEEVDVPLTHAKGGA